MKRNTSVLLLFLLTITVSGSVMSAMNDVLVPVISKINAGTSQDILSDALIVETSPYGFTQTVDRLKGSIISNNFRFIREQKISPSNEDQSAQNSRETILYFCNFSLLSHALKIEKNIGVFLPCRITVIQNKDTVKIIALNPVQLRKLLFKNRDIGRMCEEVHDAYVNVIDEAMI